MTDSFIDEKMLMFDKYLDRTNMDKKAYQYDGVKWCLRNEILQPLQPLGKVDPNPLLPKDVRGGFIADEMGLGKH